MGKSTAGTLLLSLGLIVTFFSTVLASDPDLTADYGINATSAAEFKFTGFTNLPFGGDGVATPNFATYQNVPGLTGLGLTAVVFHFGPLSQIDPHIHPRATEVFYVTSGTLDVAFVDTNNNLFETTLKTGDVFVFPKGLLHYERNNYANETASAFAALSSENPGILAASSALFTSGGRGLPDNVLAAAVGVSTQAVDSIKRGLSATP